MVRYVVQYKVKYAIIPSREIYNHVGPDSIDNFEIAEEDKPKRHLKWEIYIRTRDEHDGFFEKLEESILEEGIFNPILVVAGRLHPVTNKVVPKNVIADPEKIVVCDFLGGSRLWVCQKHNLDIPCIVSDFTDMFPDAELLNGEKEILAKYRNPPKRVKYESQGLKTAVPYSPDFKLEANLRVIPIK